MHVDEQAERDRVRRLMTDYPATFVFGSNLSGFHGAGAAKEAKERYGAVGGQGVGLQGTSYAIPTKGWTLDTLPLDRIRPHVVDFLDLASRLHGVVYAVTRIGCGLAGYTDEDMAPLFKGAPRNCKLPTGWRTLNGEEEE